MSEETEDVCLIARSFRGNLGNAAFLFPKESACLNPDCLFQDPQTANDNNTETLSEQKVSDIMMHIYTCSYVKLKAA